MNTMVFTQELLDKCIQEEEIYQFPSFSHDDAKTLGEMLYEASRGCRRTVGVEIRINGESVYRFLPDSCNRENATWMSAKANTVDMMAMSSLRVATMLALEGETLANKKMNEVDHGTLGGGFPLLLRGTGMIGTICVSGLWHVDDHDLIVRVLGEFLRREAK